MLQGFEGTHLDFGFVPNALPCVGVNVLLPYALLRAPFCGLLLNMLLLRSVLLLLNILDLALNCWDGTTRVPRSR